MRLFLAILLLSYKTIGFAQTNLIENGSFEELIACPPWAGSPSSSIEFAKGWTNPIWYYSSPDLFHICANNLEVSMGGVPRNIFGYQMPHSGNGYAGFGIFYQYGSDMPREMIQSKLHQTLIRNRRYSVSFYVAFATHHSSYKADKLCVAVTQDKIEAMSEQSILNGNYFPSLSDSDIIVFDNLMFS